MDTLTHPTPPHYRQMVVGVRKHRSDYLRIPHPQVVRACPPGTHYVDVANEPAAVSGVLDLHEQAVAANRTLVAGAGFGVLATESVVL